MVRWLLRGLGVALVLAAVGVLMVRLASHPPSEWHADPLTTERTGKPNDVLAAPAGATAAAPDIVLALTDRPAGELLAALDRAARAEPRVEVVAGSVAEGWITWVQRSRLIGFPDYVSARTVETPEGNGIAVWSRSRYGHSDLGVNRARIERWLAAAGIR
jgi:uncharacterized protein (DUF1499 family)